MCVRMKGWNGIERVRVSNAGEPGKERLFPRREDIRAALTEQNVVVSIPTDISNPPPPCKW